MARQNRIPAWLLRSIVGALFAVVGFFGRDLYDEWKQGRAEEEASLQELQDLSSLLAESYSIYVAQNDQARRLIQMLHENHDEVPDELGFDDTFREMYDRMTHSERELQAIIRGTTMHSQRSVNQRMSEWLGRNVAFKSEQQPTEERAKLAEGLQTLELHLNQWQDKYQALMPGDEKRSLVYLADEEQHGEGFPKGIEKLVRNVIDDWSRQK